MTTEDNGTFTPAEQTPVEKKASKKPAKKTAKKQAPKKTQPKKSALKVAAPKNEVLKASNMAEAIRMINKGEQRRGLVSVSGKKWSFSKRSTWAINKNLIDTAEAGLIMIVEEEGHYVYPKKNFAELFGKIFKSKTYKEVGTYSQSTLPQWHEDYFTVKK